MISNSLYRATVVAVGTDTISITIPTLTQAAVYEEVPFYGTKPSVDDEILVGMLSGSGAALNPVAITNSASGTGTTTPAGDITGVTAGLGLSGGGTIGTVSLAFAPSELSSVTVATDDKVVIADTSDSDNPKHVTVSSIAALATASPAGSDHQVQWNNSGSFGADANFTYDGSDLTLKVPLTVGVDDTGHDVKFFGATASKYMLWDESADSLIIKDTVDAVNFKVNGGQGSDGQVLTSTGSGVAWEAAGGSPAGSDHDVQFNNSGSFGADSNFTYDGSKVTIKAALDVGVDDTGHDVIFYGATTTNSWLWWDESDDALKLGSASPLFASGRIQTGATAWTQQPWSTSTIALGAFGGIGTQGSYRTSLSWNWERGTDSAFHHLDINSYPQAGAVEIGNGGILFEFDDDYETTHTTHPAIRARITSAGLILGSGTTGPILSEGSANTLRIESGDGYVDIGAQNSSYIHIYTDRENFAFGTTPSGGSLGVDFIITDSAIYPYSNNTLDLGIDSKYWKNLYTNKLYLGDEIIAADGSSGDPSYCFSSDNSAGMYLVSSGTLGWSIAAAELYMNATSLYPAYNEGLELGKSGNVWNHFWLGQAYTFSSGGYYTLRSRDSDRQVMELVSSERFKKDIVDLPLSEAYKVLDARPIKYRGIDDDASAPLEVGLSAESLHNAGYEYAVRYDEGHWGETPRSIYYEYLTAPLIAIIKDLKTRLEALES